MREFVKSSTMLFAEFPIYRPFPGTVDFQESVADRKRRSTMSPLPVAPKHATELLYEKYWLHNRFRAARRGQAQRAASGSSELIRKVL